MDGFFLRKDRDSNPGYPLGVHALSRRASSATRASFLLGLQIYKFFLIERISANPGGRSEGLRPGGAGYIRGSAPNKTVYLRKKRLAE